MKNPYYDVSGFQLSDYPHDVYYGHPSKAFAVDEKLTAQLGEVETLVPLAVDGRVVFEKRMAPRRSGTDTVARIYDLRPETNNRVLAEETFRATGTARDHAEELQMAAETRRQADTWLTEQLERFRYDGLET